MERELYETLKDERKISNESYAVKLVEKLVFGFVVMALIAIIGALLGLVICQTGCHI